MKLRAFAALLAMAAVAHAADPPKAPDSAASPIPGKSAGAIRRTATMTVQNVSGLPGANKTFTAVLTEDAPGKPPLAGKQVAFTLVGDGVPAGFDPKGGETDAAGTAVTAFPVPALAPGNYKIRAAWKGDAHHPPAVGEGKLRVISLELKAQPERRGAPAHD